VARKARKKNQKTTTWRRLRVMETGINRFQYSIPTVVCGKPMAVFDGKRKAFKRDF
jgi:hypothetical protein